MGYTGTRERVYLSRTPADEIGRCEEERRTAGWMALTRERRADGSLRVVYERLPADEEDGRAGRRPLPLGGSPRPDLVTACAAILAVCAIIVVAWSGLALLAKP